MSSSTATTPRSLTTNQPAEPGYQLTNQLSCFLVPLSAFSATQMPTTKLLLPVPPSWFPGHMRKFTRNLPALLKRTDVVLEIRDARLPLTSVNRQLEGKRRLVVAPRGFHFIYIYMTPRASSSLPASVRVLRNGWMTHFDSSFFFFFFLFNLLKKFFFLTRCSAAMASRTRLGSSPTRSQSCQ